MKNKNNLPHQTGTFLTFLGLLFIVFILAAAGFSMMSMSLSEYLFTGASGDLNTAANLLQVTNATHLTAGQTLPAMNGSNLTNLSPAGFTANNGQTLSGGALTPFFVQTNNITTTNNNTTVNYSGVGIGTNVINAGSLAPGKLIIAEAGGNYWNISTTPTLICRWGIGNTPNYIAGTGLQTETTFAGTNAWSDRLYLLCVSTNAGSSVFQTWGWHKSYSSVTAPLEWEYTNVGTVSFDPSTNNIITFRATMGTAANTDGFQQYYQAIWFAN